MSTNGIVKLNVGGRKFQTTKQTLVKYPDSMLARMFESDITPQLDDEGYVFIDSCGDMFVYILNFLRNDSVDIPGDYSKANALKATINYFQLPEMMERLEAGRIDPPEGELIEVFHKALCSRRWVYTKSKNETCFTPISVDEKGHDKYIEEGRILEPLFKNDDPSWNRRKSTVFDNSLRALATLHALGVSNCRIPISTVRSEYRVNVLEMKR